MMESIDSLKDLRPRIRVAVFQCFFSGDSLRTTPPPPEVYLPTLIVCPDSATGVWKNELRCFFPEFRVWLFFDKKAKASSEDQPTTLSPDLASFKIFLTRLGQGDPDSLHVIILTTYVTWFGRTVKNDWGTQPRYERMVDVDGDSDEEDGEQEDFDEEKAPSAW